VADEFWASTKQPSEVWTLAVEYQNRLATGETLTNPSATAIREDTGADVTAAFLNNPPVVVGTQVKFTIKDGTDGITYKVTVRVDTNTGQHFEADIHVRVKQI